LRFLAKDLKGAGVSGIMEDDWIFELCMFPTPPGMFLDPRDGDSSQHPESLCFFLKKKPSPCSVNIAVPPVSI
jgi:hypothetical protein